MKRFIAILIVLTIITYPVRDIFYIYNKYKPIENVLQEISSKEYTDDYNCVQFSKDAVKAFAEQNISAVEISGKGSEKENHRWIGIEIEPQRGRFLKVSEFETVELSKNK